MKLSSSSGFSIVIALGLTLLLSLTGLYLLEYIIPFSRNVKGVESASESFYKAYSGIEEALLIRSNNIIGYQTGTQLSSALETYQYTLTANGRFSPRQSVEEGSSEYNKDFNKLSQAEPIQLLVGNGRLTTASDLRLYVQVPDINTSSTDALNTSSDDPILLWQLSSTGSSLSATGSHMIYESDINTVGYYLQFMIAPIISGELLNRAPQTFPAFYTANCTTGKECILKISVIHPLISTLASSPIPYLEYKVRAAPDIPLREAVIETQGKSYSFSRKLKVRVPQLTTNSAFDFTVFQ